MDRAGIDRALQPCAKLSRRSPRIAERIYGFVTPCAASSVTAAKPGCNIHASLQRQRAVIPRSDARRSPLFVPRNGPRLPIDFEAPMDFSFTDEQQQLRRTVREFAEAEIAPHVMEWDEASQFPLRDDPQARGTGPAGRDFPGKVRRRGPRLHRICTGHRGAFARGRLRRPDRRGAQFAVHQSHLQIRHRGAAPEIRRACWRRGKSSAAGR